MDNDPHGGSATYGVFEDEQDVSKIAPEAGGDTLGDRMEGDSRWASDSVNWFTETFLDFDLYDKLVKPISGDFNRIEANGEAWNTAGELFWRTSANLSQNMETLVEDHWSGPGADSFKNHVDLIWTPALLILREGSGWVGLGFEKLAEVSIKIAEKCADIVNKILERIIKLATKSVPVAGQAVAVVDWVASGFDMDEFPYWADVNGILDLIDKVESLHASIEDLVSSAEDFFVGFEKVLDAIYLIPEIGSTHDVVDITDQFAEGADEMAAAAEEHEQAASEYEKKLDEMAKVGEEA